MAEHNSLTTPPPGSDVKVVPPAGHDAGHGTAAHVGQPSHSAAFPPFETHTFLSQLIWLAIAFGLLYYLMAKVALPRIESILHDRSSRLASDLDEAQRMKAEADAAGVAYEKSLRDAQGKAQGIAQEARAKLAAESDTRRKTKEAELNAKIAASETTIRESTAKAMANVRDIAGETAASIVERLTGTAPDKASLDRALDAVH